MHMWSTPKAEHFEPIEHMFLPNGLKNEYFALQPSPSKFQDLKFLYDLIFHQIHPMNMYFHKRGYVFVEQFFEINYVTLCIPSDLFF